MSLELVQLITEQRLGLQSCFLFFHNDFFSSTANWPFDKSFAYLKLLVYQWEKGGIPLEKKQNESKTKAVLFLDSFSESEIIENLVPGCGKYWPQLRSKFTENEGLLKNSKLEKVRCKHLTIIEILDTQVREMKELSELKSRCGKQGGRPRKNKKKQNESTAFSTPIYKEDINTLHIEVTNNKKKNRVRDRGVEKEKEKGGNKNSWKKYPDTAQKKLPLPEIKVQSCQQFVFLTKRVQLSQHDVLNLWELFKENHFTGENRYESESKVYNHFLNETKKQPFNQTNGVHKPTLAGSRPIVQNVDPADRGHL